MTPPDKPKSAAEPAVRWAQNIAALGDINAGVRARAADDIFAMARERAMRCIREWLADRELLACFALDRSAFPQMTAGIAVHPQTFTRIHRANREPQFADVPPDMDVREFELHFAGDVRIDVLTTAAPEGDGVIARFLRSRGEGLQQVELAVNNLERATDLLSERFGVAGIYPAARSGADGTRVNFFLLVDPQGGKLLIELVETPPAMP